MQLIGNIMLAFAFSLLIPGASAASQQPVIAILPANRDVSAPADLLTAALSGMPTVKLVEREQIEKVLREQELVAQQRYDFVKLGRLLSAEGLLVLDRRFQDTNLMLAVKFIAVGPGVVLSEHRFPTAKVNSPEWAKSYAPHIEQILPKLAVNPQDAVPLTVVNLRTAIATPGGNLLEEELRELLQFRLSYEPVIFLLERQRMEELQAEKRLGFTNAEPFWNGAYLLDGTINRDAVSQGRVTVDVRLTPPNGTAVEIHVAGGSDGLKQLVDELAAKILAAVNKSGRTQPWRTEAEAEKFYQETLWDSAWGLYWEAAQAADASWALGKRNQQVAAYRVTSRILVSLNSLGPYSWQTVGGFGFRPPPSPETLTELARALEIYRDLFPEVTTGTNKNISGWGSVGLDLLVATGKILDRFLQKVEVQEGRHDDLKRVRLLAREVNALLVTNKLLGVTGFRRGHGGLPSIFLLCRTHFPVYLSDAWLEVAGNWFEKPTDALNCYRQMLAPEHYPAARRKLIELGVLLSGWTGKDRQEVPALAQQFYEQMVSSTNTQMQMDGYRLLLQHSQDPDELVSLAGKFTEAAWKQRMSISKIGVLDAPVAEILTNLVRRMEPWGVTQTERIRALAEEWPRRMVEAAPDLSYQVWLELLDKLTNRTLTSFGFGTPPAPPRPEQVAALLARFDEIEKQKLSRSNVKHYVDLLKISAGYTNVPVLPQLAQPARVPVASKPVGTIRFTRQWALGASTAPERRTFGWQPKALHLRWYKERLWFETAAYKQPNRAEGNAALIALEPNSMSTELVLAPFEEMLTPRHRITLLASNGIYFTAGSTLWFRDAQQEWHKFPIPASDTTPYAWGEHVVLSTDTSILDFDPKSGEVRVLASSRRNPPVTKLDGNEPLRQPTLAEWGDYGLCALVGDKLMAFDAKRQDWNVLLAATNCGESLDLHPNGAMYRSSGQCVPRMTGAVRPGSSVVEYFTWESQPHRQAIRQGATFTPPLWNNSANSRAFESKMAFDGPNVWIFPSPAGAKTYEATPGLVDQYGRLVRAAENLIPTNMVLLDCRFPGGLEFRIELAGPASEHTKEFKTALEGWGPSLEFLPTPQGLAILICNGGIVLWAPREEVEKSIADAVQRNPPPARVDMSGPDRFDGTKKGWLTDAERRMMRDNPIWRKAEEGKVEAAIAAALNKHGKEWEQIFTKADRNMDAMLSDVEAGVVISTHPELFGNRMDGVNVARMQAISPWDLNSDGKLDRNEFLRFVADPRSIAEVNRSVFWVLKFGLKPELCDTNNNGVLDGSERVLVNQMIRQRLGNTQKTQQSTNDKETSVLWNLLHFWR